MSSNSQAKSNGYTQHKTVLAPPKAIESSRIPKPGPIAIVPTDTFLAGAALNYIKKELSDIEGLELQIDQQQVNEETRGIIWLDNSPGQMNLLDNLLQKHKEISWVQLPMAGINAYASLLKKFPNIIWTSAKGAFAQPVAEHALTLSLALLRYLPMRIRATSWGPSQGLSLYQSNIVIIGAGGITLSLIALLEPFRPKITILRRKAEPLEESTVPANLKDRIHVSTLAELDSHLPTADIIVAACALTPDTRSCLAKAQFEKMQKHAIVINVARGEVVNTQDILVALKEGQIGGAGLDVTDPEPLPDNHPLWNVDTVHKDMNIAVEKGGKKANLIITPHTADTIDQIVPLYSQRIYQNVRALLESTGRFEGVVFPDAGY